MDINKINHFIDNDIVIDESWGYVFFDKFKAEPSPERQKLYLKMSCALGNFQALSELAETIHKPLQHTPIDQCFNANGYFFNFNWIITHICNDWSGGTYSSDFS